MIANFVTAAGKVAIGIVSSSFFVLISGAYSAGVGACKQIFYRGAARAADREEEWKYYRNIAVGLLLSGLFYGVSMVRYFFSPDVVRYDTIVGISIAAFAFLDLGLAIAGLVRSGRRKDLLLSGLKTVNFSGALAAIALTQAALLSFSGEEGVSPAVLQGNAAMGVLVGAVSCLLALRMLVRFGKRDRLQG